MNEARCTQAKVFGKTPCGPDAFLLELEFSADIGQIDPGQFVMLSLADGQGPVLARPFSFYGQTAPDRLTFLIQVLGIGTQVLQDCPLEEFIQVTLPLGTGFALPDANRPLVMIAGGVGSAPFLLCAEQRVQQGAGDQTFFIFGARSENRLYDKQAFASLAMHSRFATDDGSFGFSGNVIACLENGLQEETFPENAVYFACGPEPLLKAFARLVQAKGFEAQVSLETYMGCGFGACNACPTATNPNGPLGAWPWAKTCQDGPVFSLDSIQL